MPTLEDAVALAARAHRGQVDKAGECYIFHPLRVMMRFSDTPARIVAVLHDVLEDTQVTAADLRHHGYGEDILAALDALTRRSDETYEEFIHRAAANPLARRVKLADLEDNMDWKRLRAPGEADERRRARYEAAQRVLLAYEDRK